MKSIVIICLSFFSFFSQAQIISEKKQSSIGFQLFYNDFSTAQAIKTSSLRNVIDNKLWSNLSNMQMGMGLSYLKGITLKMDFVFNFDASFADYLYQNGTTNGASKLLLTSQTMVNAKAFTDRKPIVPYLSGGAGFSLYGNKKGIYIPLGVGLQFNVFKEAFVFANAQYRIALSSDVNYHFNYNLCIATNIAKRKLKEEKKETPIKIEEPIKEKLPLAIKQNPKNIVITVNDESTGQPLPYVAITLNGPDGKNFQGTTDADGQVSFEQMNVAAYSVKGILNNINTSTYKIGIEDFSKEGEQINISLSHNDPRFTLAGVVINKAKNIPESGVDVTVTNESEASINTQQSKLGDGTFRIQLEANSDFKIVGKKASYLSNIEMVSTKGLNRSTTLYVKLELNVQEVTSNANIILNNIYFETGKSIPNTNSSSDLNILVQFLKDNPTLKLEIQGHTDNVGSKALNIALSQKRANSIVAYLEKNGIDKGRLKAKGYGPRMPIADNTSASGKAQNRRVEMRLIE